MFLNVRSLVAKVVLSLSDQAGGPLPRRISVTQRSGGHWRIWSRHHACLVLLSQTDSLRRSFASRDSAHGRDSCQDQEPSWKTTRAAAIAPDAWRPILPIWPTCWVTVGGLRRWSATAQAYCCRRSAKALSRLRP